MDSGATSRLGSARLLAVLRSTLATLYLLSVLLTAAPTLAQQATGAQQTAGETVTQADVDRLVKVLRDDTAREKLIKGLNGGGTAPAGKPAEEPEIDRPVTRFLVTLGETVTDIGAGLSDAGAFLSDVPLLLRWFQVRFGTPERRAELAWNIARVLIIIGAGVTVQIGVRYAIAGWRRRIAARPAARRGARIGLAAAHAALGLLPLAAFWLAALVTVGVARPDKGATLFAVAVINAHVLSGVLILIPWMILAPKAPSLRLLKLNDAMATRLYTATRSVIQVATYGSFGALALAAGMPSWVYRLVVKLIGVLVAALLAVLVLRSHEAFQGTIDKASPIDRYLKRRLADVWHFVALGFLGVALVIWLARGGEGILFLGRAVIFSALALAIASGVLAGFRWMVQRLLAGLGRYASRDFSFAARLQIYVGALSWIGTAAVTALVAVAIAEAWAIPVVDWFERAGGKRLLTSLVSLSVIVAIGIAVWEALNLMAERLIRVEEKGMSGMRRQARLRTLLPLIRRGSLGLLALFLGLMALSELGVNIGPLLAGAGVVGIAVGLGAQQIVKDLLRGVSVLVEDSIVVGDIVQVAGKSGVVEWMSMRALRLRDFDGTVHTVPFSEITSVSNQSRNYAYAVLRVAVAYNWELEDVQEVIRDTVERMREDANLATMVLDDVELHGIESFGDTTMTVLARLKVAPGKQWTVSHRFYVLLKQVLEEHGIAEPPQKSTVQLSRRKRPPQTDSANEDQADERRRAEAGRKPARA